MQYELAVVLDRFQPFQTTHTIDINKALDVAKKVLILISSAYSASTPENPFTFESRCKMITDYYGDKVLIHPLADSLYQNNIWITDIQEIVFSFDTKSIVVINNIDISNILQCAHIDTNITHPDILNIYFNEYSSVAGPETTQRFMESFRTTQEYLNLREEYKFLVDYKNIEPPIPYVIASAIVVQSGHVLISKKLDMPGKNLYCLPMTYINSQEHIDDAIIRRLREAFKLKVPIPVLLGSIVNKELFDTVSRLQYSKLLNISFLFQLKNEEELPKVKLAKWISFNDLYSMETEFYADHFHIARKMIENG